MCERETETRMMPPAHNKSDDEDLDLQSKDAGEPLIDSQDILRELFWFVSKGKTELCHNIKTEDVSDQSGIHGELCIGDAIRCLEREGILFWRDQRFLESQNVALQLAGEERLPSSKRVSTQAQQKAAAVAMDYDIFCQFVAPVAVLFLKAFSEELVIPDWQQFTTDLEYHFRKVEPIQSGQNAQYIGVLRDADPDRWALSVCSTDGQRFSIGDSLAPYTLQSVSKPVTYNMGLEKEGREFMEEWIDVEPAGRPFNTQDLDPLTQRPFNASVNSGAIMACGVLASGFPESYSWREVVDQVRAKWFELCGNDLTVGFSEETFESEKETAYNNFAIAYNLKGRCGLPRNVDLHKMIDVYLGCCSIEISTEALSVAAATLANGGVCPITGKEIFPADTVRHVLSETMTCGMYNQAGHFAVEVGLPAKSGVSGALMVIVPNAFGFATFSPRLNIKGNSVRGLAFCKRLVACYRVHIFEPLRSGNTGAKIDPRRNGMKQEQMKISRMAWAVQVGDVYATRLRDIFLVALCQTALASPEGLSERMIDLIRVSYEQIYQHAVDETQLEDIQVTVRQHQTDLSCLKDLTRDIHIVDSMRALTVSSMLDIIMVDGSVDDLERSVAIRIAGMLGVEEGVVSMELNRYQSQTGHHFRNYSYCNLLDADSVRHRRRTSWNDTSLSHSRHGKSLASIRKELLQRNSPESQKQKERAIRKALGKSTNSPIDQQEEILSLRKEIQRLRKKVGLLTQLLNDKEP